ncbi:DUF4129 domain-containing protein [Aureivirga sp. CE67]|uniref:DUF4129 domain-containing protein n=1 Tax=Aureivirga sp. CE67 TaxID=1788983 RepID=UPI0018C9F5CD|nr:DUF4129 domain-containing protein [Aureivirga sp. CE67]
MNKILIITFTFLFSICNVLGQEKEKNIILNEDNSPIIQKNFTPKNIEKYRTNPDYNYNQDFLLESSFEEFKRNLALKIRQFVFDSFEKDTAESIVKVLEFIFRYLPYILLIVVLFFITKFFIKKGYFTLKSAPKNRKVISFTEEEKIIKEADLPKLIQDAVKSGNYRLAIRYQYLFLLKILQDADKVIWAQQKTNEDYFKEISDTDLKNNFRIATDFYDHVWYGNFEISEVEYHSLIINFEKVNKNLHK